MTTTAAIPKAELHVHLEGTATPDLVRSLASRHNMALPPDLFDAQGSFAWNDFQHFLKVYDDAAAFIRTAQDYRDVTYDCLRRCAAEGAIYVEVMSSPDHAAQAGLSFQGHLDGIVRGIEDAHADFGIEARLIVTCVRHFGVERGLEVANACVRHRHPLLTGFGMGGDENILPSSAFAKVFAIAHIEAGLACTVHAGEAAGPESVRDALDSLPVRRIGHGVRAIEDAALIGRIADEGIVLEVCPTSNIRTAVYPDYAAHPLNRLRDAGCPVTLNSDDPPYFATSIGHEYDVAKRHFGWSDEDLASATATSLDAAFIDAETRARLAARLKSAGNPTATPPSGGHGPGSGR
jgi:adenosine deaminase